MPVAQQEYRIPTKESLSQCVAREVAPLFAQIKAEKVQSRDDQRNLTITRSELSKAEHLTSQEYREGLRQRDAIRAQIQTVEDQISGARMDYPNMDLSLDQYGDSFAGHKLRELAEHVHMCQELVKNNPDGENHKELALALRVYTQIVRDDVNKSGTLVELSTKLAQVNNVIPDPEELDGLETTYGDAGAKAIREIEERVKNGDFETQDIKVGLVKREPIERLTPAALETRKKFLAREKWQQDVLRDPHRNFLQVTWQTMKSFDVPFQTKFGRISNSLMGTIKDTHHFAMHQVVEQHFGAPDPTIVAENLKFFAQGFKENEYDGLSDVSQRQKVVEIIDIVANPGLTLQMARKALGNPGFTEEEFHGIQENAAAVRYAIQEHDAHNLGLEPLLNDERWVVNGVVRVNKACGLERKRGAGINDGTMILALSQGFSTMTDEQRQNWLDHAHAVMLATPDNFRRNDSRAEAMLNQAKRNASLIIEAIAPLSKRTVEIIK